jgi:hypothetical protein
MRVRRPKGGPSFPFSVVLDEKAPDEPRTELSAVRQELIRTVPAAREIGEDRETFSAESGSRDPSAPSFVFFHAIRGPDYRDERIFQIERRNGRWRAAAAWRAEGVGEPPTLLGLFASMPELFNKAASNLLYDLDPLVNMVVEFFLGTNSSAPPRIPRGH